MCTALPREYKNICHMSSTMIKKHFFFFFGYFSCVLRQKGRNFTYEKCWCAVINSIFIPRKQFFESYTWKCEYSFISSKKKVSFVHIQNAIKINHFSVSLAFLSSVVANFPHLMEHHHSSLFLLPFWAFCFSPTHFFFHFFLCLPYTFIYLFIHLVLTQRLQFYTLEGLKVSFTFNVYFCMSFEKWKKKEKKEKHFAVDLWSHERCNFHLQYPQFCVLTYEN